MNTQLEQAAQEAAEAIQDLCGATLDRHCGLPFSSEMRQIILAHVAPCCGVNRELRDALMHALNRCPNCKGSAQLWEHSENGSPVIVPCSMCKDECEVLRKYDAQSTQTKAKETDINQTIERMTL